MKRLLTLIFFLALFIQPYPLQAKIKYECHKGYKGKPGYKKYKMKKKMKFRLKRKCYARRMRENRYKNKKKYDSVQCPLLGGGIVQITAKDSILTTLQSKHSWPSHQLKGKIIGTHGMSCFVKLKKI